MELMIIWMTFFIFPKRIMVGFFDGISFPYFMNRNEPHLEKFFLKLDLIVFLELASYIFNFSTHKKNQLNTFQRFLISKLYSLGYEAYFRKLNFLKAYKFKLYESLNVLEGLNVQN